MTLARLDRLAYTLENLLPIPGTNLRIGLDALAGFVPVVGDVIMVAPASVILHQAHRLGAPRHLLIRMALNVGVDMVIGMIPFIGDIFDVGWNANTRNVNLLRAFLDANLPTEPRISRTASRQSPVV
ncbi:uncharacterized protein DUF4112 [Litoreibacter ponti]|uniref:Uncharacterized protein DUF4112 n=1 Tax=Litoreibacter ponti TaxID=1510457 RepID=A0A2T6BJK7_9RHOB|nr:DUF4112 domain-containing protein [Litoreibacter ponti]PTX56222.1 uncharacterized protein DUF4112 [Litoreibacter ponti]